MRVEGKLYYRHLLDPIIAVLCAVHAQVRLNLLVPPFGLAICLGVIGSRHCTLDAKSLEDHTEELAQELWSLVRDYLAWQAMKIEVISSVQGIR